MSVLKKWKLGAFGAVAVVLGGAGLLGCATASSGFAPSGGPSEVVARVGERPIRRAEVDAALGEKLIALEEQIFELRSEAAERLAVEGLVRARAKAEGVDPDLWLSQKLDSDLPVPSEDELRERFEAIAARLPSEIGYDDVKGRLVDLIRAESRAQRAAKFAEELRAGAGYEMLMMAPPSLRRNVAAVGPHLGPETAPIVIVEFADFECSYCARAATTVEHLLARYGAQVKFVFRHFPLSFHERARSAALAAVCADEQGKFWPLYRELFERQRLSDDELVRQAVAVGVDREKFETCLTSSAAMAVVARDQKAGEAVGVEGTPVFFVNGLRLSGAQPESAFRRIIDRELKITGRPGPGR
jgi:protein-disulfide isomerase